MTWLLTLMMTWMMTWLPTWTIILLLYIDDDMSAYMDDVDDDVATSLAHQICTAHKNSSPPHHISDYSSNP